MLSRSTVDGRCRTVKTAAYNLSSCLYRLLSHHFRPALGDTWRLANNFSYVAVTLGLLEGNSSEPTGKDIPMKLIRIVIFAKAAQPGFAKTRLIPALGEKGAADLAQRMLTYTLSEALAAKIGPVELCVTPSSTGAVWQTFTIPDEVQYSDQGEGDLGERLTRVTRRVIANDESVLLIGTDCLELTTFHLLQAANTLRHFDSTLIPVTDGGYALLGLNFFHSSLFEFIKWSTNTVFIETMHRLKRLGYSVHSYPSLHDIDEPEDLRWLPKTWRERKYA